MKKSKSKFSIRELATRFEIDRATVTKLCKGIESEAEAIAAIEAWRETKQKDDAAALDPQTGLSWWKAKLREDVLKARAGREREQQLAGGELVPMAHVRKAHAMLQAKLARFGTELRNYGAQLPGNDMILAQKLADEAGADFILYLEQSLDAIRRQQEAAKS